MAKGRLGQLPYVERERELTALDAVASSVVDGPGARLVLVTGEAGAGKSRFAAEVVDGLGPKWVSVSAGGNTTEASWSAPFAGLIDDVESEGGPARAVGRALGRSLVQLRSGGPLVLVVDDLQFVDPVTIGALQELLPLLRREPVLLLATYRLGSRPYGSPHSRAVSSLLRSPSTAELRLTSLSRDGVVALADSFGFDGDTDELYERCDGNPFLAEEAMRIGSADGPVLSSVVAADLELLEPSAVEVATALAIAGRALPLALVGQLDGDGLGMAELVDRGLAVSDASTVRLRHGLVAEALVSRLSPEERRDRHRLLAEVSSGDPAANDEDLARHWAAAGERGRAAPHALRAADRLHGQRFHATAVELYRIALGEMDAGDETRAVGDEAIDDDAEARSRLPVLEKAAMAAALAGDDRLAARWVQAGRRASRAAGPATEALATWDNPAFQRLAREHDVPSGRGDVATEASGQLVEAQRLAQDGEHEAARALAEEIAATARSAGDPFLESDALLVVGYTGDLEGAASRSAKAAADALDAGEFAAASAVLTRVSRLEIALGDLARAVEASRSGVAAAQRAGGPELWGSPQTGLAFICALRGELEEASRLAAELAALELPLFAAFSQAVEWIVAVEQGATDDAVRLRDVILPLARAFGDSYFLMPMLVVAARTHLLVGEPARTVELLTEASGLMWSPLHENAVDILHPWIAASVRLDDHAALRMLEVRASELVRQVDGPSVRGLAEIAEGAVRAADGDRRGAAGSYERAARFYAAAGRRPMALDAWCLAAAAHLETAEELGSLDPAGRAATTAVEAAEALVQTYGLCAAPVTGLRTRVETVAPAESVRLDALSERERTMVLLAAAGRTNREIGAELFISEKTVRNTLTAAFSKLGVSRRTELKAVLEVADVEGT